MIVVNGRLEFRQIAVVDLSQPHLISPDAVREQVKVLTQHKIIRGFAQEENDAGAMPASELVTFYRETMRSGVQQEMIDSHVRGTEADKRRFNLLLAQGEADVATSEGLKEDAGVKIAWLKSAAAAFARFFMKAVTQFFNLTKEEEFHDQALEFLEKKRSLPAFSVVSLDTATLAHAFKDLYAQAFASYDAKFSGDYYKAFIRWLPEAVRARLEAEDALAAKTFLALLQSDKTAENEQATSRLRHVFLAVFKEEETRRLAAAQIREIHEAHEAHEARIRAIRGQSDPAPAAAAAAAAGGERRRPGWGTGNCLKCNSPDHQKKDCPRYQCGGCHGMGPGHTWPSCPDPSFGAYVPRGH